MYLFVGEFGVVGVVWVDDNDFSVVVMGFCYLMCVGCLGDWDVGVLYD